MLSHPAKEPRFNKNETYEVKLKFDTMFPGHKWTVGTWQNIYPQISKYPIEVQTEALYILLNSNLKFAPSPSQFVTACKEAYAKIIQRDPDIGKEEEPDDLPNHTQTEHAQIHGFSTFNILIKAINDNIYDYKAEHQRLMENNRAGYVSRLKEIRNENTKAD